MTDMVSAGNRHAASQEVHDPGGRVRLRLSGDIRSDARFSDCGRYRLLLERDWTPEGAAPDTILWIGMNPSTADAEADDPTCRREVNFSIAWGHTRYLKANMLAWRATFPKDLPADPLTAQGAGTLQAILEAAAVASTVVLACGKLHQRYAGVVQSTIEALEAAGHTLWCLGWNGDGSPKHPLYLAKSTPLRMFRSRSLSGDPLSSGIGKLQ